MAFPIVLAHGLYRFDAVLNDLVELDNNEAPEFDRLHYFKGLRTHLRDHGFNVWHSRVPWGARIDVRAEQLRKNVLDVLDRSAAAKVNLVAHSAGGLDARHMLFRDRDQGRIHERVASLTTIGTPHGGMSFADHVLDHLPGLLPTVSRLGLDVDGLRDLRMSVCRDYNEAPEVATFETALAAAMPIRTFAGRQSFLATCAPLKIPHHIITHEGQEGDNDGLVSVRSARWRDEFVAGLLDHTDHLNQLGWWDPEQIFAGEGPETLLARIHRFYLDLARSLP